MRVRKYMTLDPDRLRRFWDAMTKQSRSCNEHRNNRNCNRAVFVRRLLNTFTGKCYAVIDQVDTGLTEPAWPDAAWDRKKITIPQKLYVYVARLDYYLGWSEELEVTYCVAHPDKVWLSRKLGFNELKRLKFREIPDKEYRRIQALFEDDSVKKEKT